MSRSLAQVAAGAAFGYFGSGLGQQGMFPVEFDLENGVWKIVEF